MPVPTMFNFSVLSSGLSIGCGCGSFITSTGNVGTPDGGFPSGLTESNCNEPISTDDITELLTTPAQHTVDGQTVVERSVDDIIKVDQYLASRRANCSNRGFGWNSLRVTRAIPPSASGRC